MTLELGLLSWAGLLNDPSAEQLKAAIAESRWTLRSGAPINWDALNHQDTESSAAKEVLPHQLGYEFPYAGHIYPLLDALSQLWVKNIRELDQPGASPRITYVPFEQSHGICSHIFLPPSWYIAPTNHPPTALECSSQQAHIREVFDQYHWPDDIDAVVFDAPSDIEAGQLRYETKVAWYMGMVAFLAGQAERLHVPFEISW